MARIIAVCLQKGGVGKTTTTINIGAELSALGQRVLMVDMDPQGQLSEGFGIIADELEHDISEVLSDESDIEIPDILQNVGENLDLAPSNLYLSYLELEMVTMVRREDRLKNSLKSVVGGYDYILIDCPPSLGVLTVNAFSAADELLVPMVCEFAALLGVAQIVKSVAKMRKVLNPELSIIGILPTRFKKRQRHGKEVIDRATSDYPDLRIFSDAIPDRAAIPESFAAGQPMQTFDPKSDAREAYRNVAKELLTDDH